MTELMAVKLYYLERKHNENIMNKQKIAHQPSTGTSGRHTVTEERYYVQKITEQIFVIRDRVPADDEAEHNARIIKSFDMGHDAYVYVDMLNEKQRKLDTEKREDR